MTDIAAVAVIILMGIAGVLSMFQDNVSGRTVLTRPERRAHRRAA